MFASLAGAGSAAELTPIKIATIPLEPVAATFYAKHRGMFRKQGLDADVKLFDSPAQTVPALLSGQVQFTATHIGAAAALTSQGAPVKIVAAGATYDPKKPSSALIAAPGRSITRARDLVGKTVAIDFPKTIADVGVREWLEKSGVDQDDVKFTSIPFTQALGPLLDGTVDAAIVPEPYRTIALLQGATRIAYPFQAVCQKVCLLTVYLARADVDPNVVARFRNAIQKASLWANDNKNDQTSVRILAKYVPGIDARVRERMTRTTFGTRLRVSLAAPWLPVFAKYGVIPASFKPIDLVK
ncbi:MAG: ABC transporter substrate-binding protein [Gaiellaceae bacterium]